MEASTRESGYVTGPNDEDPNLIWFAEECQSNRVRFEALIRHAERARDPELAAFFRRAQAVSHKLASATSNGEPTTTRLTARRLDPAAR